MSSTQEGPDWWRASDGNWYPPTGPPPAGRKKPKWVQYLLFGVFLVVLGTFLKGFVLAGDRAVEDINQDAPTEGDSGADENASTSTEDLPIVDLPSLVPDSAPEGFVRIPDGTPGSGFLGPRNAATVFRSTSDLLLLNGFARGYVASWDGGAGEVYSKYVLEFNSHLGAASYVAQANAPVKGSVVATLNAPLDIAPDADVRGTSRIGVVFSRDRWVFLVVAKAVPPQFEERRVREVVEHGEQVLAVDLPSGPTSSPWAQACREIAGTAEGETADGIAPALERARTLLEGSAEAPRELLPAVRGALRGVSEDDVNLYERSFDAAYRVCIDDVGLGGEFTRRAEAIGG